MNLRDRLRRWLEVPPQAELERPGGYTPGGIDVSQYVQQEPQPSPPDGSHRDGPSTRP